MKIVGEILLVSLGIVLLLGGCTIACINTAVTNTAVTTIEEVEKEIQEEKKEIQEEKKALVHNGITKQYKGSYNIGYYIEGTITNTSDKNYSYLQVEFICYDKNGNNLGTALDNVNNILAGQTWKYKATFYGDSKDVKTCEFYEVTGW